MTSDLILSAWRGHEDFARWLVREVQPGLVVDLGVDYGFSSLVFARAGAKRVIGIDSFEGDPEAGMRDTYDDVLARMRSLSIDNLELIRGYFSDVAQSWTLPIDILHIDGRHRYEDIREDYAEWSRFVRPGGVVLLHDTTVVKEPFGVHRFFAEIDLPKANFLHSNGLGVISSDEVLIAKIRRTYMLWLLSGKPLHFAKRVLRKIRKIVLRPAPPEF